MTTVNRKRALYDTVKIVLIGLTTFLVIALIGVVALQQVKLTHLGKDTRNNTNLLIDCTTPGGKCYERGRSTTSGAVGTISKVVTVSVACAKQPQNVTIREIQGCVAKELKSK